MKTKLINFDRFSLKVLSRAVMVASGEKSGAIRAVSWLKSRKFSVSCALGAPGVPERGPPARSSWGSRGPSQEPSTTKPPPQPWACERAATAKLAHFGLGPPSTPWDSSESQVQTPGRLLRGEIDSVAGQGSPWPLHEKGARLDYFMSPSE